MLDPLIPPRVLLFDVNETLLDIEPLKKKNPSPTSR